MICPKCFTVEAEDGLRCRKCGAQLHTGVFRSPVPPVQDSQPAPQRPQRVSPRTTLIAGSVLVVAVLLLVLALTWLSNPVH